MKKTLGIFSIALLIFAFIFSSTTPSEYCPGDNILRFLGLKAWSLESVQHSHNGFHYTVLITIGFAILGYTGAKHFLKEIYPKVVDKLTAIVLILFLFANQLLFLGYGQVLSFSKGINAIDYIPASSNCIFKSNSAPDLISFHYIINLKNYGNDEVKFSMRVQKPSLGYDNRSDVPDVMTDITDNDDQGNSIKEFILLPKEQKVFPFTITDKNPQHLNTNGNMRSPNITIFTKENSREFKVH